jgi:hypothetical protein
MALVLADRVKETTTTTGTGTVTLAGAAAGYQSFAAVGNGNTTYYTITDSASGAWEVGIGTYTSSGTTLSRTTVLASSNAGALVPFGSGAKDVFVTYPAEVVLAGTTQSVSPFETSLGAGAGPSVTGVNNTLIGYNAGNAVSTGTDNTFVGKDAGKLVTTGQYNAAVGSLAFQAATTTSYNSAFGYSALSALTTGTGNVGLGTSSGAGLTTGNYNIGVGWGSLNNMTTASDNVAVGTFAGGSITGRQLQGNKNVAVGNYALIGFLGDYHSASTENCAIGYSAMSESRSSDYCVAVGAYALNGADNSLQGDYNSAIGYKAGFVISTGELNTLVGANSGIAMTTGSYNATLGAYSASGVTTGSYNTAIGYAALANVTTASDNVAVGFVTGTSQFGAQIQGSKNVAVGNYALIGNLNDYNATSVENTAVGYSAMQRARNADYCAAFGAYALGATFGSLVDGDYCAAFGHSAGRALTSGAQNTLLGANAGYSGTNNLTTGSNNTIIGYNAASSSATVSNEITLGNSSIATLRCQVTTITSLSDARDKANISDLPAGLNLVKALRPVEFDWNMRDGGRIGEHDTGFIAQDLKAAQESTGVSIPGLVYENNPDRLEAGYGKLIPVLVKAIQELNAKVESLEAKLKGN